MHYAVVRRRAKLTAEHRVINAIPCNTMTNNQMQYDAMQYLCNTMQDYTIPCNTKKYHVIPYLVFDRFLKLDGSIWAVTVLDEQGVPL